MRKLSSIEDFSGFRQRILSEKEFTNNKPTLVVSAGTCGQASGANDIMRIIKRTVIELSLKEQINLRITGCQGFCEVEPFILVEPSLNLYPNLKMEDVPNVVKAAVGNFVDESLIYRDKSNDIKYKSQNDIPFFKKQTRTILRNNQKLDPIRIFDYIEQQGYEALEIVLNKKNPQWIINEVINSGLRGRGGAGFLAGKKWELASKSVNGKSEKYIICNCDEGDPGAYMDRSLLEGNPHAIIEGMIIAGIAIGATKGIIYVRGEYPLAIKHTIIAIKQAEKLGVLGDNILNMGITFNIDIFRGAGAFVCGEETALIKSIEGFMGEPKQRPPYPIAKGLNGNPTCINNAETLANVPIVIKKGAKEYAKVGKPGNTGTKIFSLVGKIKNTGLVEVPLGIKIKDVVYDIGGGSPGKTKIKAVQTGGPSGGCIPASMFDTPIDYDSLAKVGSIMGSGGMIVMDEKTCMVDVAKYFMNFLKDESCGKCFTCRKGTQRMYEILDDITKGKGSIEQLELLEELACVVRDTSMCGLGQSAANPVLSTLKYFRSEYEHHINDKKCDAYICKELVGAPCQSACPIDTEAWRYVAHIARGEYEEAYLTIRETNPFPSVCARVCDHQCEEKCKAGSNGGDPVAIRSLKRFVTDRIDPSIYKPKIEVSKNGKKPCVAIIGSGPAGLTAAHYLSLKGHKVTVFEAEKEAGGMLYCAIPSYRLPRETIKNEIQSLLNKNITIKCDTALGKDLSVESLFKDGYKAILLALGAHKSKPLGLENENVKGVYPSIEFLKAFNLRNEQVAKGRVGVIGGGNSAIDAARTALRQKDVDTVTIFYRRTRNEMPAFKEEIEAAEQEGINIQTLVTPTKILTTSGLFSGIEYIDNKLGEPDSDGRQRPVPLKGTEKEIELDTLIVAISELGGRAEYDIINYNTVKIDEKTMLTSRDGVFAAGDVVTGPNTVVQAIAAGKKSAKIIDHYLNGEELHQPKELNLPKIYIKPAEFKKGEEISMERVETPRASVEWRKRNFAEVEVTLSQEEASKEAHRCLRCDLEFTQK